MTDTIQRSGGRWTNCPELLTLDPRISALAHRLWCRLDRYAGDGSGGGAFPSRDALCVELDASWSTIDRALRELVSAGWTSKKRREAGGSNVYTLHPSLGGKAEAALWALIEQTREERRRELEERKARRRRGSSSESDDTDDTAAETETVAPPEPDPAPEPAPATPEPAADELAPRREAEQLARTWHDYYTEHHGAIVSWKHLAIRNMIEGALRGGFTANEIGWALRNLAVPIPAQNQFQTALVTVRKGVRPQGGTGTRHTTDNTERKRSW